MSFKFGSRYVTCLRFFEIISLWWSIRVKFSLLRCSHYRFRDAATIINKISLEKFPLLLTRIMAKLHIRNEKLFTEEEETQLKTLFQLSDNELHLVLYSSCYIFEQAAFTSTAPEPLYEILIEAGFDEPHSNALGRQFWAQEAPEFVNKLKARNLGGAALINTDYHLNLIVGESNLTRLQEPTALFEFTVSKPEGSVGLGANGADSKKISVEFSHPELYEFFLQIDQMQEQLDNLC